MTVLEDSPVNDFVKHYGGMDVPVANGVSSTPEPVTNWNDVADRAMYRLKGVNCQPAYADVDLTKDPKLMKSYDLAAAKAFNDYLTSCGILAMNKIDDNAFTYIFDRKDQSLFPMKLAVVHQKSFKECPKFYVNFDDNGFIVGVKADIPEEASVTLQQSSFADKFLEHHGVKGMHWGTRKDKRWAKSTMSTKNYFRLYNGAADKMNNGLIKKFNSEMGHLTALEKMSDAQSKKYLASYEKFFARTMNETLREQGGHISPTGRFEAHFKRTPGTDMPTLIIKERRIQHAADSQMPLEFEYEVILNEKGHIVRIKPKTLQQSSFADKFLEHHGVKGQKWGVRRLRNSKQRNTTFKKTSNRLSDAELNRRIKRLELEKRYNDLNKPAKSKGKEYTHSLLENSGRTIVGAVVGGTAGFFVKKYLQNNFGTSGGKKKGSGNASQKAIDKAEKFLKKHPGGFT